MDNDYKSPNAEIVGREGVMYNENTEKVRFIKGKHYGIFSNDNTYAVTFNPKVNLPPTIVRENKPVRPPPTNQHTTKGLHEPPVSLTDGKHYIHHGYVKKPPLLPPYLKKPEDLARIQGLADENNKGSIIYGPKHSVIIKKKIY